MFDHLKLCIKSSIVVFDFKYKMKIYGAYINHKIYEPFILTQILKNNFKALNKKLTVSGKLSKQI